jgi:predicted aspartyl protease
MKSYKKRKIKLTAFSKMELFITRSLISITAICLLMLALNSSSLSQPRLKPNAEVSFEFYKNIIFLEVKINGKGPFNMMLDTGTTPSALDLETAKVLGLNPISSEKNATGGGTGTNTFYDVKPLNITVGKLKAKNIETSAGDLSAISKALGKTLHGVLGHSFLNNRIVQIDYPKRVVRFYSKPLHQVSNKQAESPRRTVIPFRYTNDSVLINDVLINGNKITTLFDTGFNGNFNVLPMFISSLNLEEEFNKAIPKMAVGFRGKASSREGIIKTVKIGSFSVNSPSVIFWEKGTGHDTTSYGFTIGNGFLKDFKVTIDYRNSSIMLEKD